MQLHKLNEYVMLGARGKLRQSRALQISVDILGYCFPPYAGIIPTLIFQGKLLLYQYQRRCPSPR